MPSPLRSFRKQQKNNNEKGNNKNPNIGDLSPIVKANLSLQYKQQSQNGGKSQNQYSILGNGSSSIRTNQNQFKIQNIRNGNGDSGNKDDDNDKKNEGQKSLKPLSSTRDPRRRQLQSRLPFAPFSHGTFYDIQDDKNNKTNKDRRRRNLKRRRRGDGMRRRRSNFYLDSKMNKMQITPAYAYKNVNTGFLEISFQPPKSYKIDGVVNEREADPAAYR